MSWPSSSPTDMRSNPLGAIGSGPSAEALCSIRKWVPPRLVARTTSFRRPARSHRRRLAALQDKGQHAAECAHLPGGKRVAGIVGKSRVKDQLDMG